MKQTTGILTKTEIYVNKKGIKNLKNFVLWGTKKGQPDFTECVIEDTPDIKKIQQAKVWAVKNQYHHLKVEAYNDNYNIISDDLKTIRI